MKIRVSISREFDTSGEHAELFDGVTLPKMYAKHLFIDDIERLVKDNDVSTSALVEEVIQ